MITVSDYLERMSRVTSSKDEYVYRGQADVKWPVDCSAVRRLTKVPSVRVQPDLVGHMLVAYLAKLLRDGERFIGTCSELPPLASELDILIQLQHQGAATGFIDFSSSPLVALWFACADKPDTDGAVYMLARSYTQAIDHDELTRQGVLQYFYRVGAKDWDELPYLLDLRSAKGRPMSQQSVFILGVPFIRPHMLHQLVIPKADKDRLLQEMRGSHQLTEDKLFPDFAGYARANASDSHFDVDEVGRFWKARIQRMTTAGEKSAACVDYGMALSATLDHKQALGQYTAAIELDQENMGAYINRGATKRFLGDLRGAVDDLTDAIHIGEQGLEILRSKELGRVYWLRARLYSALRESDLQWSDLIKARDLGLPIYVHIDEKTDRVKGMDVAPELGTYKSVE